MKALPLFLALVLLLSLGSTFFVEDTIGETGNSGFTESHTYNRGCRYNSQGWIFVHIEGEPYERGYQYGYLLSREIIDMINRWSHIIHNAPLIGPVTGNLNTSRYDAISQRWWNYCKSQIYTMYWNDYPLEYQDEIRGIAAGVTDNGGQVFEKVVTIEDIFAINEMYEFITKLGNSQKSIHFLRTLFDTIRQLAPGLTTDDEARFISSFLNQSGAHHCTGFIATGGATTTGQIVVTQATWFGSTSWWFNAYIAERWNVIVDIQPDQGNRLLFTTAPGYIWSDENYYQNQEGLVILDTTAPQGLWARGGVPLAVRSRMAAQYGGNIDEVISYLLKGNDGVWTAVWLIGDTKTGEIARMDLGLYNHGVWRTHDGFYWSANNIMDARVRAERRLGTLKGRFLQLLGIVYPTTGWYEYYTREYHPNPREVLFEELGQTCYGDIDVEWMKDIMSSSPFTDFSADTKVSDSFLIDQDGFWVHWGNPGGIVWNTTDLDDILPGGTVLPPSGWVCLYGLPGTYEHIPSYHRRTSNPGSPTVFWEQKTRDDNPLNTRFTYNTVSEENVYAVTSTGVVSSYDATTGHQQWIQDLTGAPVGSPVCSKTFLAVGAKDSLYVLNKTTGQIIYRKALGCIASPVIIKNDILVGCENQVVSLKAASGSENWMRDTPGGAYPSPSWENTVFIGTGSSVWALDSKTGEIQWIFETHGPITTLPQVDTHGRVYVGSWDTHLYALDAKTGTPEWVFPMGWGLAVSPVIKDETIYFGSMDNNFYSLETSRGDLSWSFTCHSAIQSVPLIYGDSVFFGCDDGYFYALNRTTGNLVWRFSPGYSLKDDTYNYVVTPLHSNPVAHNGTVFLGARGTLYALDAQTREKEGKGGQEDGNIAILSEIPCPILVIIIIIGCIIFFIAIHTYRHKKEQ